MNSVDYSLYIIADTSIASPSYLLEHIHSVVTAGATCLQLRMKNLSLYEQHEFSYHIFEKIKHTKIPLIINDNITVAQEPYIDGVHIGQSDLPWQQARQLIGNKIIGLSIENTEQAIAFATAKINYFGVGPVFNTQSKPDAAPAIGIESLPKIKKHLKKPVVAIGGINHKNLSTLLDTGIDGIAVISSIWGAKNPAHATKVFNKEIKR